MTFQQIRKTIQAHDVQFESCDRDGQEFCDCLTRAIEQTEATFAAALRELRARIAAESVSLTPENAAGYSRDIADAENATVERALQYVDATIAKLSLEPDAFDALIASRPADEALEEKK